jgi:urease gamma subunit
MANTPNRAFDPSPPDGSDPSMPRGVHAGRNPSTTSKDQPMGADKSGRGYGSGTAANAGSNWMDAEVPDDEDGNPIDLLALIGRADQISKDYQQKTIEQPLSQSYRAWNNQHANGSKYLGNDFKGRSRLFVPKTRSAVRKNMATAALALFANDDVVNISAAYDDDPAQQATAAVLKADLAYRMGAGVSAKVGMPWFVLSMGACQESQLTGVCISKQFWEYEEVPTRETELKPLLDEETGLPVHSIDEFTGQPSPVMYEAPKMRVVKDRPMCELMPIENAGIDPASPWYAPAQLGRWFIMRYPVGLSDLKAMLNNRTGRNTAWLPVDDGLLLKGRIDDERAGTRRAREGAGSDRFEDGRGTNDLDIVWIQENFLRIGGIDYTWWSIGRHGYISKVRETQEAYPEFDGERPYVMGLSGIDPHRVFPMSPVQAWQPLQLELNDITNLRQDALKRSIEPLTKVVRGKNVDRTALMRRGQPNAVLEVDNLEDVDFLQTPGPTGASYTETSMNNSQFDELAGVFSTSSVQSNRQLNETVGGMKLMSGAANAVSEFDLRVWVETWVEPAVRQIMHLVRSYESDEKILQLSGAKARVAEKFGYVPSLTDFDTTELSLRVNVGIGALDPMQQLSKFKLAMEMIAPMAESMKADGIKLNWEELIAEIMGKAGYKDGRRFFEFGEAPEQQQDPKLIMFMKELEFKNKELEQGLTEMLLELRSKEKIEAADNLTAIHVAEIREQNELLRSAMGYQHDREGREFESGENEKGRRSSSEEADKGRRFEAARITHEDRREDQGKAEEERRAREERLHGRESEDRAGKQRLREILAKRVDKNPDGSTKPPMLPKDEAGKGGGFTDDLARESGEAPARKQLPAPTNQGAPPGGNTGNGDHMREQLMGQMVEAMSQIMGRLEHMNRGQQESGQALGAIANHMAAPVQIIRDPKTNAIVGMRKGNSVQQILREQDSNRISGSAPLPLPAPGR